MTSSGPKAQGKSVMRPGWREVTYGIVRRQHESRKTPEVLYSLTGQSTSGDKGEIDHEAQSIRGLLRGTFVAVFA